MPRLGDRVPDQRPADPDDLLERFLGWVADIELEPYPAQEEALLELMSGRHVILNTPTGSGKSLVALATHFKALGENKRSFYTSPIKALVSEKFFDLCHQLGAQNVGMLTGDASINHRAPVICCTAEVLANMAVRDGAYAAIDYVVMDEFHYFADTDRGVAWQLPLITLPQVKFVLMSATLGDVSVFVDRIGEFTGAEVSLVRSDQRPVPLDFEYSERPIHETLSDLTREGRAPVYVVNFTQREAAELAQGLTSAQLTDKQEKHALVEAMGGFRFDTTYGKDMKRFLRHGVGLHHAGLLPKYRTLVERLSQKGLLKVICGTDTLGVGVNIPIRTVLFTKLCKFDGEKVRILSVRDFKQIAGRAGRKGFDDRGWVVAQAPEHVIENKKLEAKARAEGKKKHKAVKKKPPERGYVPWDAETFAQLQSSLPEPLESTFQVNHGLLLSVLQRELDASRLHGGYARLVELIGRSYERDAVRSRLRRKSASLFKDLRAAGVIEVVPNFVGSRQAVRVAEGLQKDFSLHHTLSLYLLDALYLLDPNEESYGFDVVSLVESILESPRAILLRQLDKLKGDLVAKLKAEGVEYEQRMEELDRLEHPKPLADFIYRTFDAFRAKHPWVQGENVRPKSIVRDMVERYAGFNEYVKLYGLGRSEGVLLRYLSQAYKALVQSVPDQYKDEQVENVIAYLHAMLSRVDTTLLREWEAMTQVVPAEIEEAEVELPPQPFDPTTDPKGFEARLRADMHAMLKALSQADYEEVATLAGGDPEDPESGWTAEAVEEAIAPFIAEYGPVVFDHQARLAHLTHLQSTGERTWKVQQTLRSEQGETEWMLDGEVDLRDEAPMEGALVRLVRIGV